MIGLVAAYLIGFASGAAAIIAHKRSVQRAVAVERTESQKVINQLKGDADRFFTERNELLKERELNQAYMQGRKSPLSDVEKFAMTLEKHNAKLIDTTKQ